MSPIRNDSFFLILSANNAKRTENAKYTADHLCAGRKKNELKNAMAVSLQYRIKLVLECSMFITTLQNYECLF